MRSRMIFACLCITLLMAACSKEDNTERQIIDSINSDTDSFVSDSTVTDNSVTDNSVTDNSVIDNTVIDSNITLIPTPDSQDSLKDNTEPVLNLSNTNPIIWADVPDPDVIRVGDYYYMVSTTMHMTPGAPIMRSADMVNWELVSYAYEILENDDIHNLINGNAYGRGSWAASIRYHEGYFYVCCSALETGKTYIFKTKDIEQGDWERTILPAYCHDPSLFFDEGHVYIVYGASQIWIRELEEDLSGFKSKGIDQELVNAVLDEKSTGPEGSHMYKIGEYYYLFLIDWPRFDTQRRREWCFRSKTLLGDYEGKIVLDDNYGYGNSGVAQGGIFDTPKGDWYGIVFQDHGAVGRIPMLVPVTWEEDWPIMGIDGKVPETLNIEIKGEQDRIVASDEFDYDKNSLILPWQFNHNPDSKHWSVTERPGYLRITTDSVVTDLFSARNTLTQRTMGPMFISETKLETTGMKVGDYAGIAAFQYDYGMLGVKSSVDGKFLVLVINDGTGQPKEEISLPLEADAVYLKIEFFFGMGSGRKISSFDKAYFKYSYDGETWVKLDYSLPMTYKLEHFMGYRSALFCYSTKQSGGYADFDYYRCQAPHN